MIVAEITRLHQNLGVLNGCQIRRNSRAGQSGKLVPFSDTGVDLLVINNQKYVMTALSGKQPGASHNATSELTSELCPSRPQPIRFCMRLKSLLGFPTLSYGAN
jgi:hypothetical protein